MTEPTSYTDIDHCSYLTVDDQRKAKSTAYVLMDIIQEEGLYVFLLSNNYQ